MAETKKFLNYSDVFYSFFSEEDTICHNRVEIHFLMYVCSGEMTAEENGHVFSVKAGECVFVRRDHRVRFSKNALEGEPFKSITLHFKRNFLRDHYQKMQPSNIPKDAKPLESSVFVLPKSPFIDSIFHSMLPFFESEQQPRPEMLNGRLEEALLALLDIDEGFYPALFNFTDPWKIDILDFMDENYMYDLSMEEIASYTGRSLSTFKRDFKKVSDLSPEKWLVQRRLNEAYKKLQESGKSVTDVYLEVGFKNFSHFSTAFKKQFGVAPSSYTAIQT